MKTDAFVDIKDSKPKDKTFVMALNYTDGWQDKSYFDKDKFWIVDGPLKGFELPYVEGWRYLKPIDSIGAKE